jgi:hypothetical protein
MSRSAGHNLCSNFIHSVSWVVVYIIVPINDPCYMLPSQLGIGQVHAKCVIAEAVILSCLHMITWLTCDDDLILLCIALSIHYLYVCLDWLVTIFARTVFPPCVGWWWYSSRRLLHVLPSQFGIGQVHVKCVVAEAVIPPCLHMTTWLTCDDDLILACIALSTHYLYVRLDRLVTIFFFWERLVTIFAPTISPPWAGWWWYISRRLLHASIPILSWASPCQMCRCPGSNTAVSSQHHLTDLWWRLNLGMHCTLSTHYLYLRRLDCHVLAALSTLARKFNHQWSLHSG